MSDINYFFSLYTLLRIAYTTLSIKLSSKKMLGNAKASLAMEGLIVTEEETEIGKNFLEGKYSEEEALNILLRGVKKQNYFYNNLYSIKQ